MRITGKGWVVLSIAGAIAALAGEAVNVAVAWKGFPYPHLIAGITVPMTFFFLLFILSALVSDRR